MQDDAFDAFVSESMEELDRKQAQLEASLGLGRYSRFDYDQRDGSLTFSDDAGHVHVKASVTPIGSYSERSGTWQWAWANQSVLAPLRERSERLRELKDTTGMDAFDAPTFEADEELAWQIAAVAVRHLGALGCYRAPSSDRGLHVFLAIDSVQKHGGSGADDGAGPGDDAGAR